MDLVVNAPVKAAVRRERATALFDYFQSWKIARLKAERDKLNTMPEFKPAKPKLADGISTLLKICDTTFKADKFVASLSRCFVDVCLAPESVTTTEATYKMYKAHTHGTLNPAHFSWVAGHEMLGCLAEAVTDMNVTTRNEDEGDDSDDDSAESDSSTE